MINKFRDFLIKIRLELIVFFGGGIGMTLEIVGSRVVSPYFGNSLVIWTSLIGVILGCLSLGYFYGGKLADKNPSYQRLSSLLLIGATALGVSAFFKEPVLGYVQHMFGYDIRAGSVLSVMILFGPVSVVLGTIAPFAARLRLEKLKNSGATVGNLYALSTFGSITGTFLAGFYLIPNIGNTNLLYALAAGILVLSLVAVGIPKQLFSLLMLFLLNAFLINNVTGIFRLNVLVDVDSQYNRILVRQIVDQNQNKMLGISIDNAGVQSVILPDNPDEIYFNYIKAYRASDEINPMIRSALMVGGGGYTFPRDFLKHSLEAKVDVVEIDPKMTEIARKYFFLKDNPRMQIFHQDARSFLNESNKIYDVIFLDAFNSLTPPPHLTTLEFMSKLYSHLSDKGFLMINLVSSLSSDNSDFLSMEINTLKRVFSTVKLYKIEPVSLDKVQNIMVIAYKEDFQKPISLGKPFEYSGNTKSILTDDWSPVEYLTRNYY